MQAFKMLPRTAKAALILGGAGAGYLLLSKIRTAGTTNVPYDTSRRFKPEDTSLTGRISSATSVLREHAVAAKDDVKKGAGEVAAVVRAHGEEASRDVSTAKKEIRDASSGEGVDKVVVRDTPPVVRTPIEDNVRVVERGGTKSKGPTISDDTRSSGSLTMGGGSGGVENTFRRDASGSGSGSGSGAMNRGVDITPEPLVPEQKYEDKSGAALGWPFPRSEVSRLEREGEHVAEHVKSALEEYRQAVERASDAVRRSFSGERRDRGAGTDIVVPPNTDTKTRSTTGDRAVGQRYDAAVTLPPQMPPPQHDNPVKVHLPAEARGAVPSPRDVLPRDVATKLQGGETPAEARRATYGDAAAMGLDIMNTDSSKKSNKKDEILW